MFKIILLFITFNFSLLTFNLREASAQTFSLSIWPPLLEVMIQPGKSITQVYKIANSGDEQILLAKILPFEPADSKGNIKLLSLPMLLNPLSFSFQGGGVSLGKPFLLKSGESKDLVLKLTVPKNTPEKDFYASLVFETSPEGRIGLSQTQTAAKIGANLLITVSTSGTPVKRAEILEFSNPAIVDSFDAVPFVLRVENISTAFFKTMGKITIDGILKQEGTIKLLPENILADSARTLTISPWQPKFIFGPFRARVEFSLDEEKELLAKETTFLALPYKAILALIVVFLILISFKNLPKKINNP